MGDWGIGENIGAFVWVIGVLVSVVGMFVWAVGGDVEMSLEAVIFCVDVGVWFERWRC